MLKSERIVDTVRRRLVPRCAYCDKIAEGNFDIHRDGFGVGPLVPLCDACGSDREPTAHDIWARIAQPSSDPLAFDRDRVEHMTGLIAQLYPCEAGGYGFIDADNGERLYFNASGLQLSSVQFPHLKAGDKCRFTAIDHPRGPRAIEVFVADERQGSLL